MAVFWAVLGVFADVPCCFVRTVRTVDCGLTRMKIMRFRSRPVFPVLTSIPISRKFGAILRSLFDKRFACFGQSGRFWFRDPVPTCDAILAIAYVLKSLSESDAPFSEVMDGPEVRTQG